MGAAIGDNYVKVVFQINSTRPAFLTTLPFHSFIILTAFIVLQLVARVKPSPVSGK